MRAGDEPCRACFGGAVPCKGGGNLQCWRRRSEKARIAIILDTYGGARTIVGTPKSIKANTRHDELVHTVPKLVVHEPIAWNDIPIVIERARIELMKWLDQRPNLTEIEQECVTIWRLRELEHASSHHSLNLDVIAFT